MDYYDCYTDNHSINIEEATQEYETSVYKYKDERDAIQKKTFTKWVNKHLIKATKGVVDLFEDLRDGNNLIWLLEILSGESLPREKGKMRVHKLQNVQTALKFLTNRNIKLVNIRPDDIVDGNPKLTLGLIWTIILHFQLSDLIQYDDTISFKEALLKWARKTTEGYPDVNVKDFTHSWKDGLAFNAILHRNRPDLIDYRSCRGKSARENLEHAFSLYESLGVTRLLDPEDVDCKQPDEKSLITYISSLYELFPEPPENNPLLDHERLQQIEHYKKLAENLVSWMRDSIRRLNDRSFPATLKEMRRLQEDANRFRSEEIPPHFADKQLLVSSYKEILKMSLALPIRIEEEYKAESIEKQWKDMMHAFQERDRAMKEHIAKLDDLEHVAERLRKNIRECDRRLDEIAERVHVERARVRKVNPLEPYPAIEQIAKELKFEEERIASMFKDARYLREEKFPNSEKLYQAVQDLQRKHSEISLDFKTNILDVFDERRAKAQRRPMTEEELIQSNPSFRFLHECIEWCRAKQHKLATLGYGTDLFSVQKAIDEQRSENAEIAQFQSKVDRCDSAIREFEEKEVREIYERMLARLHKAYAELKQLAANRMSDLESLLALLREIESEGKWTEEVISPEIIRNWASKDFALTQVENDHQKLYYEIQSHEHKLDSIISQAERMLRDGHPATECIGDAVNTLTFKKKLLFEMFNSLPEHKRLAVEYQKFHSDASACKQWLEQTRRQLNTTYSATNVSTLDDGDRLNRDMATLKCEIDDRRKQIADLESRSTKISPLHLRTSASGRSAAIVSSVQIDSSSASRSFRLRKGEQSTLSDNSDPFAWRTQSNIVAPNLCFLMAPPDRDATSLGAEMRRAYDDLISLWAAKNHELRQAVLLATIRGLKSWDYPTYCAKDPAQIDSILRALETDIRQVVAESKPGDAKSQQLLDEFADLRKKFAEYEARRRAEADAKSLQKLLDAFVHSISDLLERLLEKERIISKRLQDPIPRQLDAIKDLVLQHKEFEIDTRRYEPQVELAKAEFAKLPKSPDSQQKFDTLIGTWNKIWSSSNAYIERLKALEIVLRDIDDAAGLIANFEIRLARSQDMPAEIEQARTIFDELKTIYSDVQRRSTSFDKLLSNVSKVRRLVERSRLQQTSNADIDRLEEDVKSLHKRWDNIASQIGERIKSLENCNELLRTYRSRMEKESTWFKQTTARFEDALRRRELNFAKQLYEDVSSHKASIDETNTAGERFMKEAKIYDMKLKNYREQVEEYHPSIDAAAKRTKIVNGIEVVTAELKHLREGYEKILNNILALLNQLQDDESKLREFPQESQMITVESCTTLDASYGSSGGKVAGAVATAAAAIAFASSVAVNYITDHRIQSSTTSSVECHNITPSTSTLLDSRLSSSNASLPSSTTTTTTNSVSIPNNITNIESQVSRQQPQQQQRSQHSQEKLPFLDSSSSSPMLNLDDDDDSDGKNDSDVLVVDDNVRVLRTSLSHDLTPFSPSSSSSSSASSSRSSSFSRAKPQKDDIKFSSSTTTSAATSTTTTTTTASSTSTTDSGAKFEIFQQKSTTATGSTIPLDDDDTHLCASSIVSTVNLTQNIKSEKKENFTEITINRVYETEVKNLTSIVKSKCRTLIGRSGKDQDDDDSHDNDDNNGDEDRDQSSAKPFFDDRLHEPKKQRYAADDEDAVDTFHPHHDSDDDDDDRKISFLPESKFRKETPEWFTQDFETFISKSSELPRSVRAKSVDITSSTARSLPQSFTSTMPSSRRSSEDVSTRPVFTRSDDATPRRPVSVEPVRIVPIEAQTEIRSFTERHISSPLNSAQRRASEDLYKSKKIVQFDHDQYDDDDDVLVATPSSRRASESATVRKSPLPSPLHRETISSLTKEFETFISGQTIEPSPQLPQSHTLERIERMPSIETEKYEICNVATCEMIEPEQALESQPLPPPARPKFETASSIFPSDRQIDISTLVPQRSQQTTIVHSQILPSEPLHRTMELYESSSTTTSRVTLDETKCSPIEEPDGIVARHPVIAKRVVSTTSTMLVSSSSKVASVARSIGSTFQPSILSSVSGEDVAADRFAPSAISLDFAADRYRNLATDETHSLAQAIKLGLIDFAISTSSPSSSASAVEDDHRDESIIRLSDCVQSQTDLLRFPGAPRPMTFAELIRAGVINAQNCTLIDRVADRTVAISDIVAQPPCDKAKIEMTPSSVSSSSATTILEQQPICTSLSTSTTTTTTIAPSSSTTTTTTPTANLESSATTIHNQFPSVLTISSEEYATRDLAKISTSENEISDRISQWLAQKERLIAELGPICSEPRRLASQLQQVQMMKEDFASQSPMLNKMDKLGDNLLERFDSANPECRRIKNRREEIHAKWQHLSGALDERERNLLAVKDAAADFQSKFEKLTAALHRINDDFDRITTSGADNEEQLLKLSNLEETLEMQRPAMADLESACERLVDLLTDSASKTEVRNRVADLRKLYDELSQKINDKKAELQSYLKADKEFFFDCDAMQEWLRGISTRLSRDSRISALLEKVQRQVADFEPIYREVLAKEHEIHILVSKAAQLQKRLTRPADITQLNAKIDAITREWNRAKQEATAHHTRLQKCLDNATKYNTAYAAFTPWLAEIEAKMAAVVRGTAGDLVLQKQSLEKVLREFQLHKNEIGRHVAEFENVCTLGEALISSADIDTEVIRDQLNELKRRWADLQQELTKAMENFERLLAKLGQYGDKARDLNNGLNRLDDKLTHLSDKDPKQLEKIKAMLDDSRALGEQLEGVKKLGFGLIDEAGPNIDSKPIRDELRGFEDKYGQLSQRLDDASRGAEQAAKEMAKFADNLSAIQRQLASLEERFERMAPIGRSIKVVEQQLDDMTDFNRKLAEVKDSLRQAERDVAELIAKGYAPDPAGLRAEMDGLGRRHDRLADRSRARTQALEDALDRLKNFHRQAKDNMNDIRAVIAEVDAFPPISRDVDAIRSQQKEFQTFNRSRVEPLAERVSALAKAGNDLIQSAPHGVQTSELEQELEKQGEHWNELKSKMNERERKLDQALMQAGRFQDALNSVEKWLTETEEMVRNQKPPSSDYVALKAQLQEQKFLKKMLVDRKQQIDSLQELGKELMTNLDRAERTQIEKQLADIDRRFNALMQNCDARMKILENSLPIAKEFADKIVPLQEWLEQAARKLNSMQSFSIEQDKLTRRIAEHKEFHRDVLDHQRDFKDLSNVAQKLIYLIQNEEEGQLVTSKLADITDKYAKLVEDSVALGKTLADSMQEMAQFMSRLDKINAALASADERLSKYKVLSIYPDKLAQQCDDLQRLMADIDAQDRPIAELVAHAQSLLKRFSANDSMFIRQKVDAVQSRYNDLRQRAADKLDHAKASLTLSDKFYGAHDQLNQWMDVAEEKLQQLDALSLSQQNAIITGLEAEVPTKRRLLDTVNNIGAEFARTSPGTGAATINGIVTKCNRRFDAIVDQLQRRSEKLRLFREQNATLGGEVDELLEWFRDAERQLLEAEPIVPNYDELLVLLREAKSLADDIATQKARVRDVVANVKRMMRDSANDELSAINRKADELKELAARVSQLCQDRLNAIEHALPLVEHFFGAHHEISQFLDEAEREAEMLSQPSIYAEQIRKQQEATKRLMQAVASNKPLIERLNKTGGELIALLPQKADARQIQQIIDTDNERYNRLKAMLREHQNNLESALQSTSQFVDKLDGMLNALHNTHDQLKNAEPIAAHVPKITEQIADNAAILDDLAKRENAYNAVKAQAKEVIAKAGKSDEPAIRDIRHKLDKLTELWNDCQRLARDRGDALDEALRLAKIFWSELSNVMRAIKQLEDQLNAQEPAGVEPAIIEQQQNLLHEIGRDLERTKPHVENCKNTGRSLMKICGEPEKPDVRKNIEDLDNAWDNVTALYARREQNLIDAMDKAMNFHEKMRKLLDFLADAEKRFAKMGPIASDIDAVKRQIGELKSFKSYVDPFMVEVEALNRLAHELLDRVPSNQARSIRESIGDINRRWKDLLKAITDRQAALDKALLQLGQFQHALNELLAWIAKVEKILSDTEPIYGDPQVIEVELAKHKVLMNDIHSHQASVDSLNQVGKQLIDSELGSESARANKRRLDDLNVRWNALIEKADSRSRQLEECLRESQHLAQEIQDMLAWLNEIDNQISTSKPVGGLPETAREQLNRFMEVYNELVMNRHRVETLLADGDAYVSKAKEGTAVHLSHNLKVLRTKWENILARANDRKIKLEIALKEATEFHEALQDFVDWLTSAEKYLSNLSPVSRVLENVLKQIEEHKQFQKDIGQHRETMLNLDKKGTHLKYFSQKQDVTLIKNLLASVQHRWERVLTKAAERARALDHGFKEAKEFYDSWSDLISWLDDAERTLDSIQQLGNNPDLIKQTLYRHKEFQRQLGAKQSTYDSTMRFGKGLKEKAPKEDLPILQEMLDELKNKWNAVCQKSVDKQRKLEEALLFSGQFKDAIQALIEWLEKAKQLLAFDQPVHGDLETVNNLIDGHRSFIEDFNSREANLQFVRRTANDLIKSANAEDVRQIKAQMDTLEEKWAEIERMIEQKHSRLNEALQDAKRLQQSVHSLLEWLSDAELKLRFAGPQPEDEAATRAAIAEHENFLREMKQQETNKNGTLELAREILQKCHPNASPVIKHWITIIQSRWDEVESWAAQREKRLNDNLKSLKDASDLLEETLAWLVKTEEDLARDDAEPLPDDVLTLERLIDDHQKLIDDMNDKQIDVERVVKAYSCKQPKSATSGSGSGRSRSRQGSSLGRSGTPVGGKSAVDGELRSPKARELLEKWQTVWKLAMDRAKRLKDSVCYNREIEKMRNFDYDDWRRRFLFFMENKKSKMLDFYKRLDKDNDSRITKTEFIDGVLGSRFTTNRMEMERVADIFDTNGDRYIDQKEYLDALRPDKDGQPKTESEIIQDEVQRQVGRCTCTIRYKVFQVGDGKYRFGDSQKLRLVRILRSTVMVRVGGGWVSLEEFLTKNDPCRARGRTNVELREQFVLADGVSQSMAPFKARSPFRGDGTISLTGPISKIREKTERSIPLASQGYRFGGSSNESGASDAEPTDARSRSRSRLTPTSSRPGSRQSSQPSSRTASDMSVESLDRYNFRRSNTGLRGSTSSKTGNGTTATTTASGLTRTPSFGSRPAASTSSPIGPRWK